MEVRGDVLMATADLDGAKRAYNDALEIRKKLGANGLISETHVSLAALAIEENRLTDAEDLVQQAIPALEGENAAASASGARQVLAVALVKQGKFEQARAALRRAEELRGNHPDPLLRLSGVIEDARLDVALAKHDHTAPVAERSITTRLRAAMHEARRLGYWQSECEARLVLAEINAAAGKPGAHADLEALEQQAHTRGYELTARKARLLQAALH